MASTVHSTCRACFQIVAVICLGFDGKLTLTVTNCECGPDKTATFDLDAMYAEAKRLQPNVEFEMVVSGLRLSPGPLVSQ